MTYRLYPKRDGALIITESHSHSKIAYYSKLKMKELYPDGGYTVIGEIGNFAKKYSEQDIIATDAGKLIPIFPCGSLKKPFEWVAGYSEVGKDMYTAVVKSIIPHFMQQWCETREN